MNTAQMIVEVDKEIARLQRLRNMLAETEGTAPKRGPGRPRKAAIKKTSVKQPRAKRAMSAQGRANIAAGQKKRRAAARKKKA